jgi:hypothetical protein
LLVRWRPDEQMVAAMLTGRCTSTYSQLSVPDRCWAVAGLEAAGLTAEEIAPRLGCCVRTVRVIQAQPMTEVCKLLAAESEHFADELRLVRSELTGALSQVSGLEGETARLRRALARYTAAPDAQWPLCSKGLHPMTPYNTYTATNAAGRRRSWCRECHRDRQRAHVARKRQRVC